MSKLHFVHLYDCLSIGIPVDEDLKAIDIVRRYYSGKQKKVTFKVPTLKAKKMDKKIKKIQKETKHLVKEEASLLKMDKKHDKVIAKAKKKKK